MSASAFRLAYAADAITPSAIISPYRRYAATAAADTASRPPSAAMLRRWLRYRQHTRTYTIEVHTPDRPSRAVAKRVKETPTAAFTYRPRWRQTNSRRKNTAPRATCRFPPDIIAKCLLLFYAERAYATPCALQSFCCLMLLRRYAEGQRAAALAAARRLTPRNIEQREERKRQVGASWLFAAVYCFVIAASRLAPYSRAMSPPRLASALLTRCCAMLLAWRRLLSTTPSFVHFHPLPSPAHRSRHHHHQSGAPPEQYKTW